MMGIDAWMFWMRKLVGAVLLPPAGPLLVLAVGLWLSATRLRRTGRYLAWLAWGSMLGLSVPWVAAALTLMVGGVARPVSPAELTGVQAIVVLGGGLRAKAQEYGGADAPSALTQERVRYAAWLSRSSGLPILVTGGPQPDSEPEAVLMARMLEHEYGVPVRWLEPRARNTFENAAFSAELLAGDGITRVALVSHAVDARRARREFTAAGLRPVAAPTAIPTLDLELPWDVIPGMRALYASYLALYEALANLAMTLAGR